MIRSDRRPGVATGALRWTAAALLLAACGGTPQTDEPEAIAPEPVAGQDAPPVAPTATQAPATPVVAPSAPIGADTMERMQAIADAADRAAEGDFASARADLQQLVSDPEVGGYATYNLGVIAFYEGQAAQAEEYWERALSADPDLGSALAAIVRLHLRDGDVSGARSAVNSQLAASDNAPQIRAVGLYVDLYDGRYDQVIRDAREILLLDDGNLDVHYALAMANLRLGRVELARYVLEQGLERDASRPDFYFGLAEIEILADNNPGARTWLRRALDADPHHPESWNNLGLMQLQTRAYSEAVTSFTNATRYAPSYPEAWLNLGNAEKGTGDYAAAQEAFEQALALDRTYADPLFNLGVLYLDAPIPGYDAMGRYEQAIRYFNDFRDRAGAIPPDHPVNEYLAEAQRLYDAEIELQNMGSGGGSDGGDGFSDEGGDEFDFGGGGDDFDFGDDGGDDFDFGDDGGDDFDFGDDGGDDFDFGDDGGDDFDFGDEESSDGDASDEEDEEDDGDAAPDEDPFGDDPFGGDDFEWSDDNADPFGD